ncbi:GH92 family glycosyl hydrolase [Adhaeretor mobilis]|uniref:Glycosyl hydrolase family 92 n=1 Tax=Adhaeretor mobilis TaxID=1930276 RepID=A0A517N194_9BACT|nr:GH92 family glycosyl hydrolase [Adhaeretor mobilis]QDT00904.1 Glycosyl hydrolase family 92 [Adhaeretor mobilis]
MKLFLFAAALLAALPTAALNTTALRADETTDLTRFVNPQIDTHNSRWFYFSSACRPFGMVNLSPDTQTEGSWKSGYLYGDDTIRCFSHVHAWQMSGIAVMPTTGPLQGHLGMDAYESKYSHDDEVVRPGYHKVYLDRYKIAAELTSTCRVGWHRYTFPASEESYILFDTGAFLGHGPMVSSKVQRISETEIAGYALMEKTSRRPKDTYVYFVAQFNKPFTQFISWSAGELQSETESVEGANVGAAVKFATTQDEQVLAKVAISYTSIEGARKNLAAESPHWDFDRVVAESTSEWNEWLGRIQVSGGTLQQQTKLYTDLWHSLLGRRIISDVDGKYCDMTGPEPKVRQKRLRSDGTPVFDHYNFDALWGSHWSLNILWSMSYPQVMDGFCETMIDMYRDGGLIPRGPSGGNYTYVMIGDPASSFFATAFNKGIRSYDYEAAYEGLRKNAFPGGIRDHAGYEHKKNAHGGGMQFYVDLGYVPEDMGGSGAHRDGAAMTLEYAYQDWCLAQFAKALGKEQDYRLFMERSQNYRNLWDPEMKLMRPKMKDGSWMPNFQPYGKGFHGKGFCESNSMIYSNYVPHDMAGLIQLFGGQEAYSQFLNGSFDQSVERRFVADHGKHAEMVVDYDNQPGTAMAHLFNYSGKPWLSQKWVREVKLKAHGDVTPYGGYHGDEDQGQMGALGVLMAIGLFQVDGGAAVDSIYEITTPLFEKTTINLAAPYYPGDKFEIVARNRSPENIYIQTATLNGKPLSDCWIRHSDLVAGGKLELTLGATPNKQWGSAEPPSDIGK